MKKLGILLTIAAGAAMINAQKIQQKDIPTLVQSSLQHKFPDSKNVKWEKEKDQYEAEFKSKGTKYSVLFDAKGNVVETEVPISVQSLSDPIKQFIAKKHPKSPIKDAAKITDSKGVVTYEAEVNGMDLIFDTQGNFFKEIKD